MYGQKLTTFCRSIISVKVTKRFFIKKKGRYSLFRDDLLLNDRDLKRYVKVQNSIAGYNDPRFIVSTRNLCEHLVWEDRLAASLIASV